LRTFSRIALASDGISKSIDMAFPLLVLAAWLDGWHNPGTRQRQRQTKFEALAVIPRMRGIQYAAAAVVDGGVGVYWIVRIRG
jgi:hypothetical protein